MDNQPTTLLKRELSLNHDINNLQFLDINTNSFGVRDSRLNRDSRRKRVNLKDERNLYF